MSESSELFIKLYQELLISQEKSLLLLTTNLYQNLYKHHVLLKVTDAFKSQPGKNQINYC